MRAVALAVRFLFDAAFEHRVTPGNRLANLAQREREADQRRQIDNQDGEQERCRMVSTTCLAMSRMV